MLEMRDGEMKIYSAVITILFLLAAGAYLLFPRAEVKTEVKVKIKEVEKIHTVTKYIKSPEAMDIDDLRECAESPIAIEYRVDPEESRRITTTASDGCKMTEQIIDVEYDIRDTRNKQIDRAKAFGLGAAAAAVIIWIAPAVAPVLLPLLL